MLIQANRGPTDGQENTDGQRNTDGQGNTEGQGNPDGQGSADAQGSTDGPCPSVNLLLSPVSIKNFPFQFQFMSINVFV